MAACDSDSLYIVPIAWNDNTRRFEPILCIDVNGNVVFYDGYACPEYRCPLYSIREEIVIPPLHDFENPHLTPREEAARLVEELHARGIDIAGWGFVAWCYTGNKECEEASWETWQDALRRLAPLLNNDYEIVELREEGEGDSILLAVKAEQIGKLEEELEKIVREKLKTKAP